MARSRSQTAEGKAVYLLRTDLRVPTQPDAHFAWHAAGTKVPEDQLEGLNLAALEAGGFIEKVAEAQLPCEACAAHGDDKAKKKRFTPSELSAHYRSAHPGLAAPEEV